MDVMSAAQRRKAMKSNRGRTQPERALASGLWRRGLRYLTHEGYEAVKGERLSGKPDMLFPLKRIAIFVDGCFWHGCHRCGKYSGLSGGFWINKIDANRRRDQRITAELESVGWMVVRVPEHNIRTKSALARTIDRLVPLIQAVPSDAVRVNRRGDDV